MSPNKTLYKNKMNYYVNNVLYGGNNEKTNIENALIEQFSSDEHFTRNKEEILHMCKHIYNSFSEICEAYNDEGITFKKNSYKELEQYMKKYRKYILGLQEELNKTFFIDFKITFNEEMQFDFGKDMNTLFSDNFIQELKNNVIKIKKEEILQTLNKKFEKDKEYQLNETEIKNIVSRVISHLRLFPILLKFILNFSGENNPALNPILNNIGNTNNEKYIQFTTNLLRRKFPYAGIQFSFNNN